YAERGLAHFRVRDYDKAAADFTRATRLGPELPLVCGAHAWFLAVCPKDALRDGKKAVGLATRACELTGWKEAVHLAGLAAAHAECGNFKEAARLERKAIDLGYPDFAREVEARDRLKLYEAGRPHRE